MTAELRVYFEDLTPRKANQAAQDFKQHIDRLTSDQLHTERLKTCADTQDAGSIIAIALDIIDLKVTIVAVKLIAVAIRFFLARNRVKINIHRPDGKIIHVDGTVPKNFDTDAFVDALLESLPDIATTGEDPERDS